MVKLRPSALPMLADCTHFESGGSTFAEAGSDRHTALSHLIQGDPGYLDLLPDDEVEAVEWAFDYIQLKANSQAQLLCEEKRELWSNDGSTLLMEGTPDVVAGSDIFDLKWRKIDHLDYAHQMAAYALMVMNDLKLNEVRVHVLYAQSRYVNVLLFDKHTASSMVYDVIQKVVDKLPPHTCDHCGWCQKRLTCPAINMEVAKVIDNREDWKLETYHSSEITNPVDMARALVIARTLNKWCEAVEFHAKEMALKGGIHIPGFKLQHRKGRRQINDLNAAFNHLNIPPQEFLDACTLSFTKLEENYARHRDIPKNAAKKEVSRKLEPFIENGPETISLVKERKPHA